MTKTLVLKNGRIVTMDDHDCVAQAVAICGDRITAVGSVEEVLAHAGPCAEVVDLEGVTVLPGLIDTHAHFSRVGRLAASTALLYDCTSIEEILSRLQARGDYLPDGAPIHGQGDCFRAAHFAEGRQICASDLDRVAKDRPVVISDVHKRIVNSYVLEHCVQETPPAAAPFLPEDLRTGEVPGLFFSSAMGVVNIPGSPLDWSMETALQASSAEFARYGVTTVADPHPTQDAITAYIALNQAGKLDTRVVVLPATQHLEQPDLANGIPAYGPVGTCLRMGPAKQFYDSFIMHRTACMFEPYCGEPDNVGMTRLSLPDFRKRVEQFRSRGWPMAVHVTGDRGLVEVAQVLAESPPSGAIGRSHVIHAYFPVPSSLQSLAESGVGMAVQPGFLRAWGETVKDFVGNVRAAKFLPLRTCLDSGVVLGGGSDAPIVHWNPFRGMATAMDRQTLAGSVLGPEEGLTAREALALYTRTAAKVLDLDADIGSVESGKLADLTIVDRNVLACSPAELAQTQVQTVIVAGRVVRSEHSGT